MEDQVVTYVCGSPIPVGARHVSQALSIGVTEARRHLAAAVDGGRLVRLAPGKFVGPSTIPEGQVQASALPGNERDDDAGMRELEASAWTAMRQAPPMPAAWFREPTFEELPPGSGGVHYRDGRIYGWVAQAGEPHAGMPGKSLTIESLGELDLTHFLRARFALDDGTTIRAGAFTMSVGHHRDGSECETASCQFDDTRTVAGIVTVGMNEQGLWFSGAAAPWLAEWDRSVFAACQPSYHMKQGRDRRWQLRAVLSVPVPGHCSPLVASAVAERSNLGPRRLSRHGEPAPPTPAPEPTQPTAAATQGIDPAAIVQAVADDPALIDVLASALGRRHAPTSTLAEIEQLSQRLAPARAQVATTLAAQINGGK